MKRSLVYLRGLIPFRRSGQPRQRAVAERSELMFRVLESRFLLAATHDHEFEIEIVSDDFNPASYTLIEPGTFLTSAQSGTPLAIADRFLHSHSTAFSLLPEDLSYRVTSSSVSEQSGTTHIYLQQTLDGRDILNAVANVSVAKSGAVVSAASSFVSTAGTATARAMCTLPEISAEQALRSFAMKVGFGLEENITSIFVASNDVPADVLRHNNSDMFLLSAPDISRNAIPVERVLIPVKDGLESGWRLNVPLDNGSHWYDASVSAVNAVVLDVNDWVSHANYVVFAAPKESPSDGVRTNLLDPHNTVSSPFGWHDTNGIAGAEFTVTSGNNVFAYTDTDANNTPDPGSSPDGGASLQFNFPLDLAQAPSTYQPAAVTNLFYATNFIHDVSFRHGFDEASGNFQVTNYSGLGTGGDSLNAEAQDGSGTNNANFATPPEGTSPRMQMYVWTDPIPDRDGDLDNGIIYHEFGHGISNRLTGGPANSSALSALQSGGMGEGWSDVWSLLLTQSATDLAGDARGIGTYALNQPPTGLGIRSLPYSYDFADNDHTFADITGSSSVHFIGETWATTLWDLNWALIQGNSLDPSLPNPGQGFTANFHSGVGGNTKLMKLIIEGMKLQPANPSFLQARDAILQADLTLNGGQNIETIWRVFARRGMGFSATDNGSNNTNVTEAFDLPIFTNIQFPNRILEGSHVSRVAGSLALPLNAGETRTLRFIAESGSRMALTLIPTSASTVLTANIRRADGVFVAGPFTAAAGQPVKIAPQLFSVNSNFKLEIHSTDATGLNIEAVRNSALESQFGDTTGVGEVNLANSFVNVGAGRFAVIGHSASDMSATRQNLPSGFIDISGTGTALNLSDDQEVLITTTVGNSLLPAGTVVVGNNGGLLSRTALTDVPVSNAALNSTFPGIFPFWDDIDSDTGNVFWKEQVVGGINTLIVQWEDRPHFSNIGSATFQVQIFATGTKLARFAYEDVDFGDANFNNGASATIGVVSPSGTVTQHSFNTANSVLAGDVIDFTIVQDIDGYKFNGSAGQIIDVIYSGLENVNMSNSAVELKQGGAVIATAVTNPLSPGVTAANYSLGISGFVLPANAVYTVRIVGREAGDYVTLVTRNAAFNTENSNGSIAPRPRIGVGISGMGYLQSTTDTADEFVLNVNAGQTYRINLDRPFDLASMTPANTLGSRLQLRTMTGTLLASDTNSGPGGFPQITYTATSNGDVRLNVARLSGEGEYTIKVQLTSGFQGLMAPATFPNRLSGGVSPESMMLAPAKSKDSSESTFASRRNFRWTGGTNLGEHSLSVQSTKGSFASSPSVGVSHNTSVRFKSSLVWDSKVVRDSQQLQLKDSELLQQAEFESL